MDFDLYCYPKDYFMLVLLPIPSLASYTLSVGCKKSRFAMWTSTILHPYSPFSHFNIQINFCVHLVLSPDSEKSLGMSIVHDLQLHVPELL